MVSSISNPCPWKYDVFISFSGADVRYGFLSHLFEALCNYNGLVGMESRLEDVGRLLDLEATDVRFIGIWGMGGIGKTTLASKVFDRFSSQFEVQCFIPNLREHLERCTIAEMQQRILSKLLGKQHLDVGMPIMSSSSIRKWIMRKKVLVVLDDVWDFDVVEFLVGKQHIYSLGSRIVMTTRYKQILNNIGAEIYQVKELNDCESLKLFSSHACKHNSVPEKFKEVARKAVEYAGGNPLALRVLGSNLYGKKVAEWKDQLKRLENISAKKIEEILRISYDKLDDNEKEYFLTLHVSFTQDKGYLESVLESCFGRYARIGITALIDKCLINVSDMKLKMHDLLRQMGRDIVHKECIKNPGNRSRLWNPEDIYRVLSKDMGTISVESLSLDITRIRSLELSPTAFVKISNLRFLKFYRHYFNENFPYQHEKIQGNIHISREGLNYLPEELTYLYWFNYPFESFPFNF